MYTKRTLDVLNRQMDVLVFMPDGVGPHPGMVVAQHLPVAHAGLEKDPFTIDVGEKLAQTGYATAIPYMFHWWPPEEDVTVKREQWDDDRSVADLDAAFGLLSGLDSVDASRIGIIGHCWGGRVAWLGAARNPEYKAVAVLYGGRIKLAMGNPGTAPIALADRIKCPMIGIFGNDDQNPSPADVDDLDAALTRAGVAHEFHRYDGAGHGFQDFVNQERYRKIQTEDSWAKVLAFLARTLTAEAAAASAAK